MREITAKYGGECRECGTDLSAGERVIHERRVGIFCLGCAPTDPEEIRRVRQEAADRKAERLEGWAAKREVRAEAEFKRNEPMTRDWAFITQPGHIPERARILAREDKQRESLAKARKMRARAQGLRSGVRVKGDAANKRAKIRDYVRPRIKVGDTVQTAFYGSGVVLRVNKKTARIGQCGQSGTWETLVDLTMITPPRKEPVS